MARSARKITVSRLEREQLNMLAHGMKTEKRLVDRSRIILACAEGKSVKDVASDLGCSTVTVIKWKDRFLERRMDGLLDEQRGGRPLLFAEKAVLKRIAELTAKPAPDGYASWTGDQLAKEIGCSADTVWRLMRKNNICLDRHRSWCVSTDPSFAEKATDIVGLYLNPPENALVLSVDEKPGIQALTRKVGYVETGDHRMVRGIHSTYRRNGTVNLFAALDIATGAITGKPTRSKRREDFLFFMDSVVADNTQQGNTTQEIDVILDNYCTHKRCDGWLEKHPNVHFHYTPTSASWLNMVELWFTIMSRRVLKDASFTSTEQLTDKIQEYIEAYDRNPHPFKWRKRIVHGAEISNSIANLIS